MNYISSLRANPRNIRLVSVALCTLIFCSGCVQNGVSVPNGYRIQDGVGPSMLVPDASQDKSSAKLQTAIVNLSNGRSHIRISATGDCAIHGAVFSLLPRPGYGNRSWVITSPGASGWDTLGDEADVDARWRQFLSQLARMHRRGCFPSGLSTQFIRSTIAESIPLPASLVPIFRYSDRGEPFVNLAPGMEIRIQKLVPGVNSKDEMSEISPRIMTAEYDVVSQHQGGIGLRLSHRTDGLKADSLDSADSPFLSLGQRFAATPVMRLFLQGFSEDQQGRTESNPILIGAVNTVQLEALSNLIHQRNSVACVDRPGTACIVLPHGSVSLFSVVRVNGHRTACSFGAPLLPLLSSLSPLQQTKALQSIRIRRRSELGHYRDIQMPRTADGAREVLLLPGDRIDWKN